MCVRTVNIDEARLRRIDSSFSDMEFLSKNGVVAGEETMSIEEARAMTLQAVREEYARP